LLLPDTGYEEYISLIKLRICLPKI
jgi:hypothetical protein